MKGSIRTYFSDVQIYSKGNRLMGSASDRRTLAAFRAFKPLNPPPRPEDFISPARAFFWAGLALFFMSVALLIRAWARKKANQTEESIFGKQNTHKIILFSISVFLYAFLLEELGFVVVTLLLFLFLLGVLEKKKWIFTVWVSVVVTAVTYLIFETWLQSQLPRGILDSLRF
jgi:putative tricarboxylic transport membrane protein